MFQFNPLFMFTMARRLEDISKRPRVKAGLPRMAVTELKAPEFGHASPTRPPACLLFQSQQHTGSGGQRSSLLCSG